MSTSVLIAGLGYIGTEVAKALLLKGYSVVGVTRTSLSQNRAINLLADTRCSDRFDARSMNLCSLDELRSLPACDVVVFCAAARSRDEQAYREIYLEGLRNLLSTIQTWPVAPRQLIFTSSTGVYHQQDGSIVTEESATRPHHFSGQIMLQSEELIRTSGLPHLILRLSGIYGPGRDRIIQQVRDAAWETQIIEDEYQNYIHRDDAVAAIVAGIEHENFSTPCIVSDREPTLKSTIILYIANELQKIGERIPNLPTFVEKSFLNKRCLSHKLQRHGFVFKYPSFRDGVDAIFQFI